LWTWALPESERPESRMKRVAVKIGFIKIFIYWVKDSHVWFQRGCLKCNRLIINNRH
jgi:hypothetical protein